MRKHWDYKPGDWWVMCDVCGKKLKASHSRHRWDGLIVCDTCYEPRHSLDFVKAGIDKISVPFTRPQPQNVFISVPYIVPLSCVPSTTVGESDRGTADCAKTGITTPGDLLT